MYVCLFEIMRNHSKISVKSYLTSLSIRESEFPKQSNNSIEKEVMIIVFDPCYVKVVSNNFTMIYMKTSCA